MGGQANGTTGVAGFEPRRFGMAHSASVAHIRWVASPEFSERPNRCAQSKGANAAVRR